MMPETSVAGQARYDVMISGDARRPSVYPIEKRSNPGNRMRRSARTEPNEQSPSKPIQKHVFIKPMRSAFDSSSVMSLRTRVVPLRAIGAAQGASPHSARIRRRARPRAGEHAWRRNGVAADWRIERSHCNS
jgi:hypothetical protein